MTRFSDIARRWKAELEAGGYERRITTSAEFRRLLRLPRTWRTILKATRLRPGAAVFEFGCGGGNQLIPLALHGYRCAGIDCSEDVLARCRLLMADAERFSGRRLSIRLHHGDFLDFRSAEPPELVFNFGVIEHFLDDDERRRAVGRMFSLCAPGGHVVCVVPSGTHPLRARMRAEGLGGYRVPEIDYTPALLEAEMREAGASAVRVIPHNLFGYRLLVPATAFPRLGHRLVFWGAPPLAPRRLGVPGRDGSSVLCVARKGTG